MRVIYISTGNVPSRWAHTFQLMKMAEALAGRVAELTLLTAGTWLPSRVREVDLASWYGVEPRARIVRLPVYPWRRERFFTHCESRSFDALAAAYARRQRPDLVYARSTRAGAWCVRLGLPTVIENHTLARSPFFDPIRAVAGHPALRGLVTVTNYLRDDYIKAGFPPEKLFVWPDAVDLRRFAAPPDAETARLRLDLPTDGPLALYAGHFYPEKGVPTLIDAARLLPAVNFVLVGGWPDDIPALRERARGLSNLRFEGFVENERLPLYLAAADVLVLPNSGRDEHALATSPLKLFEYLAARRPVVATRIPALDALLHHGENAWLVDSDTPEDLADGVRRLIAEPELAGRLAARGWRDVQQYTWERRADEILHWFTGEPSETGLR